jgi:isopenicillin-N epimerase
MSAGLGPSVTPANLPGLDRRQFLVRTGLFLSASLLGAHMSRLAGRAEAALPFSASWESVRSQFTLKSDLVHMASFYLASHPAPVREAIERHRRALDENPFEYVEENEERFEAAVLGAAATYLGGSPGDIALTDSTTMGLGLLYGGLALRTGQEVLTTTHDHYSTQESLRLRAERTGATIRTISLYRDLKTVSREEIVETLVRAMQPRTRIVAVTWVHSSTGLKLPIRAMAEALAGINASREEADRALLCVDGVHGLAVEQESLADLGCDFFIAGCHKWLFGPRGTGLVWGKPRAWPAAGATIPTFNMEVYRMWMKEIPPSGVPHAARMTPGGFHSFEHRWALDEAFKFHLALGKARVTERIHALNTQLKAGLAGMPHIRVHTPRTPALSAGIVCFEADGMRPQAVVARLRQRGIVASVTPYATKYVRLAPSLVTSSAEVDRVLQEVRSLKGL